VRAAQGETGIVETKDYRGEMVLAAYTHVPLMKWGFVAKRDLTEVYAPIRKMLRDMALIIFVAAVIIVFISLLLAGTISRPILVIREVVGRFAKGDLDARCPVTGSDEIAALGTSFNETAATLAGQITIRKGGADIFRTMSAAGQLDNFASDLIVRLIDISGSHLGAFYRRSENGQMFQQIASVGLNDDLALSFNAKELEGELGEALTTGNISRIRNIPPDTVFTFKTTAGTAIPREIITIPLVLNSKVEAVVSLATLDSYADTFIKILEQARIGMNAAYFNLVANAKIAVMADELRESNEETTALNEELQEQTEELQEQTEELQEQTVELQKQAVNLETQSQQVIEASRLKSEFLSNMSHELRTPLNSVLALSQLMLSRGVGNKPEDDIEQLQVIERNGQLLLKLINEILDLSKIEAGQMELAFSDIDPREIVERVISTMRPLANEKALKLEHTYTKVPRIHSDGERIGQILLNLLGNAVKFTEKGQIGFNISATTEIISFALTDTGIGISETDLPHIFEEFRQVDGSTTRKYGGTGLGLAICQKMAFHLGGDILVDSTLGEGSTFTLQLPLRCPVVPAGAEVSAGPLPEAKSKPGPRRRRHGKPLAEKPLVLMVEDNEIAVLQVRTALEEYGYRVNVAADGEMGLIAVNEEIPDAIILDLNMPGIDGFQVLEQLRSEVDTMDVPVLVLTAKELTVQERASLKRNNIYELIQKGNVDRDELVATVSNMIDRQAASETVPSKTAQVMRVMPSPSSDRSDTILVVEDNADNLLTIKAILDNMGCSYIVARDGEQAVTVARESRPGLILMDIQLPIMSGLESTRRIKADPKLNGTPIVALTARAMAGDREEILAAGCDDYLSKPLDTEKVKSIVRKWKGRKEKGS
jgi:signal transduction histidine kinase/DNA-binding response OmpR family regulator/HAMP domain-containing protein